MIALEVDGVRYTPEKDSIVAEAFGEKKRLFLEKDAEDFCVGIYGDGCGGGRVFVLYKTCVKAYDLENDEEVLLLDNLVQAKTISKDGCILSIETAANKIRFNLSTMKEEQ